MRARGTVYSLGTGARKSLVLFWSALFLSSLLLQYMSFAAPASVLAVHDDGLFELDGNAMNDAAVAGDDWSNFQSASSDAYRTRLIFDEVASDDDDTFTGGSTKDDIDIDSWLWKYAKASQAKNDITHAFAAAYKDGSDTIAYFGLSKYEADGNNFVGFWFLKNEVGPVGAGTPPGSPFSDDHQVGDILVLANYTNGGTVAEFNVLKWVGSGGNVNGTLQTVATGVECGALANDDACGETNSETVAAPTSWNYQGRDGDLHEFPPGTFFEAGLNLTNLGLDDGCFTTFMAETRASQSVDATLSDFALGSFSFCVQPDIDTQVWSNGQSTGDNGAINKGESVTDKASLTGDNGTVTGSVEFFVCYDASSYPDCDNGGTKVGSAETLSGGEAESDSFTPTQIGKYCFRVEYTPAAGSKYLAGEHTNKTSECFRVIPADVRITKVAADTSVSAGEDIAFTVTWSNVGEGKATDVDITDELPGDAGLNWSIQSFTGSGSTCVITGAVGSQELECLDLTINGSTEPSGSVTVTSGTTPATCGTVDNRADITSGNDGSGFATADIDVLCPDIKVTKEPDAGDEGAPASSISAGDTATFTIKVENIGDGTAKNVELTDNLPNGIDWADDSELCTITPDVGTTGQVLDCDFGDMDAGDEVLITLTGTTDAADCGTLDNTASASADNEGDDVLANNTNSGAIDVKCADIDIEKTADNDPINAGDEIGFTVTVTNDGDGTAYDVDATDTLPTGFAWTIESQDGGWAINAGILTYAADSLAPAASSSVHIVSPTDPADCALVTNTADVEAGNDGTDTSTDTVLINCPDLKVTKTANPAGPVNAGDDIGFDITIENLGPGTAYDVELTDTLPAGFAWSLEAPVSGWSLVGSELTFAADELAANASSTVTVVATSDAEDCGPVNNMASAEASNEPSNKLANNEDRDSVTVNCPDVTVTKTADNSPISAGDIASFTIEVENLGPGTAYDVALTDTLPAGINWSDDSAACEIAAGILTCDFGDLADGATRTVTVTGETRAADCGDIPNTAEVSASNEPAGATGNNDDDATIVVECADITLTKTADDASVSAGDQVGFTITVTNTGAGTAYGVTVTDTLPTDAGTSWTIESQSGGFSIAAGVLAYGPATLAKDASVWVHIVSPTTAATCGTVDNMASVTTTNDGSDDDSSEVDVLCPDVTINKMADNSPILGGQDASFTITVWNEGPGIARNVEINDELPAGYTWTEDSDDCEIADGDLICQIGDLEDNEQFSVTVSAGTDVEQCADIPNVASVTATNEPESKQGNNEDDDTIDVQCADISLVKTAGDAPDGDTLLLATLGDVEFTYVVENTGTATLIDIELIDDNATPADPSDDVLVDCPKTTLDAGESMTCTVTLPTEDYGLRTNIAVAYGHPELDPEEEVQDDDDAVVNVPEPVVTPTPRITPPPTDSLADKGTDSGNGLFLLLAALAGVMLTAGYLVPATAKARRSKRS